MSKGVQANANLQLATELQRAGFKSLLDAQPQMRERFIEMRRDGFSIAYSRKTLLKEFPAPEWHVPSRVALERFVKNRLQEKVVVEPYMPDYNRLLRKLDPIQEKARSVGEAKRQYEKAVKANVSLTMQSKLLVVYSRLLDEYQTLLDRKGITRGAMADNIALHQHTHFHQNTVTNGHEGSQDPHETSENGQESATNGHGASPNADKIFAAIERLRGQASMVASQGSAK